MESVSRTAGSSSTTKISPRETGFSAMFHRPCVVKPDAHSNNGTQVHTGSKRTRICTGRSLNAQVATHPLNVEQESAAMRNATGSRSEIEPGDRNDAYGGRLQGSVRSGVAVARSWWKPPAGGAVASAHHLVGF